MSLKFDLWPLELLEERNKENSLAFYEFFDGKTMSAELYQLPAGGTDHQKPHDLDELYFIITGKAQFMCGDSSKSCMTGDTIYVAAHVPHYFYDIERDLKILVVFSKKLPDEEERS